MSNFDRAVKALNDVDEAIDHLADNEAYVAALAAEGLLAPDLPEPDAIKLNGDIKYFIGKGVQVRVDKVSEWIQVMLNAPLLASEARQLAYALLAAAAYSEAE